MLSTYALLRSVLFVQPAWLFATLTLYLERRREGAKVPHGSFAHLHAAPVQQQGTEVDVAVYIYRWAPWFSRVQ
jgi:hypothetical protein